MFDSFILHKYVEKEPPKPNLDLVEVVRCKDCIHWKRSAVRKSYCETFDWASKAEDFCSFAERRADE